MKKKLILPSNKLFVALYLAFHIVVALLFAVALAQTKRLLVDSDLFNMMPQGTAQKAKSVADKKLLERTNQNTIILVSHEDFSMAKKTAQAVYDSLKESPFFLSLALHVDNAAFSEMVEFIHENRFHLLSESVVSQLDTADGAEAFAQNSLAAIFGGFTLVPLDYLATDPFLLDQSIMQDYLNAIQDSGTSLMPKDGVLATEYEGRWYVMLNGTLSREGAALASKHNGVTEIYRVCEPLEVNGIRFVYSGTPFHSHKSSTSAAREISFISTGSFLLVLVMLFLVFRTPVPIFASAFSIVVSVCTGFAATYALFKNIHVLSLVFATSLIGCCIDYSLHFFMNWKANKALSSGGEIRRHLATGLGLSFLSTELCYLCLFFAPFVLLKQIAVFSFTGILSTFLTTVCLYPLFKIPSAEKRNIAVFSNVIPRLGGAKKTVGMEVTLALFALSLGLLAVFHKNVRIKNNVSQLYKLEGRLKNDTVLSLKVMDYAPSAWFVIGGKTPQDVLEHEEALCSRLAGEHFFATSRFIPSIERQKKSFAAAQNLVPFAPEQCDLLGLGQSAVTDMVSEMAAKENSYLVPDGTVPTQLQALLDSLWLGKIDDTYYSVVLPSYISDKTRFASFAADDPAVYFESKADDVSAELDNLSRIIFMLFTVAYVLILCVLKFFYTWRQTAKIASIPLLSVLVTTAVFAASGQPLEFFAITGMILVFGLGLDYVIYMMESAKRAHGDVLHLEAFAIALSFLTTVLSFGALALSAFVPVHVIGLSIFLGLSTAFVCTML